LGAFEDYSLESAISFYDAWFGSKRIGTQDIRYALYGLNERIRNADRSEFVGRIIVKVHNLYVTTKASDFLGDLLLESNDDTNCYDHHKHANNNA
jgi:hypothetical protein